MKTKIELIFQPASMSEVFNAMNIASFLEFSTDKPGNIGPNQSLKGITFKNFKFVSSQIKHANNIFFEEEERNGNKIDSKNIERYEKNELSIGIYIFNMVKAMMDSEPHENLLLGHILLYSPFVFTSKRIISSPKDSISRKWNVFWKITEEILDSTSVLDAKWLVKAILLSNAGGLKRPGGKILRSKYDITDPDIEKKIDDDNITLKVLFKESSNYDLIARQYVNNYKFCRDLIENWVISNISKFKSKSDLVLNLFLYILSKEPDSLIYRKNNKFVALKIQNKAKKIQKYKATQTKHGRKLIYRLNKFLTRKNQYFNPGTTADLTATVIFLCFLFGIIKS